MNDQEEVMTKNSKKNSKVITELRAKLCAANTRIEDLCTEIEQLKDKHAASIEVILEKNLVREATIRANINTFADLGGKREFLGELTELLELGDTNCIDSTLIKRGDWFDWPDIQKLSEKYQRALRDKAPFDELCRLRQTCDLLKGAKLKERKLT
jgi:hypothetical protein